MFAPKTVPPAPFIDVVVLNGQPVFAGYIYIPAFDLVIFFDHSHQAHWRRMRSSDSIDALLRATPDRDAMHGPRHANVFWGRHDGFGLFGSPSGAISHLTSNHSGIRARTSTRASRVVAANELAATLRSSACRDADCDGERHYGLRYTVGAPRIGAPSPDAFSFVWHIAFAPLRIVPPDPIMLGSQL